MWKRLRLGEKCKADEDQFVEFKMHEKISLSEIPARCQKWENGHLVRTLQPISKTICAFLNTKGGVIYVGIRDNKEIRGRTFNSDMKDHFLISVHCCVSRFHPPLPEGCVKVGFIDVDGYDGDDNTNIPDVTWTPAQNSGFEVCCEDNCIKAIDEFQQLIPQTGVDYHVIGRMGCLCKSDRTDDAKLCVAIIKVWITS
uniref:AlbA_2 domain-containing protein n=1 Tax=Angiostrongylus cantonensis TaxID=6313 RepID=A0A158PCH0_ANGCA